LARRTKIVATIGPAVDTQEMMDKLIGAGVNVVRLNFSHGSPEDHMKRAEMVRNAATRLKEPVAILGDLQGPKIRIARFAEGKINVAVGDKFAIDVDLDKDSGNQEVVGCDYEALAADSKPGDHLLLDDGRVVLEVDQVNGSRIDTTVIIGGPLSNNKGINRKGGGLSAPALTEKDREDIKTAAAIGVDYLAVSFPRCAEDMNLARRLAEEAGSHAHMVAKIERAELADDLDLLDEVIVASDAVMVARGDLGVEIGDARLIGVQKHIIDRARALNRVVITATQMMESMITAPMPTRAEVSDVANAVFDGTDAVMLSAESAAGDYPIEAVEAMARSCVGAEEHPATALATFEVDPRIKRTDEAIAVSAVFASSQLQGVKAIVALTETGTTPLWISRYRSSLPIYAFSRSENTRRRVSLYRSVRAINFSFSYEECGHEQLGVKTLEGMKAQGLVEKGDIVLITRGDEHAEGQTNTLSFHTVQ